MFNWGGANYRDDNTKQLFQARVTYSGAGMHNSSKPDSLGMAWTNSPDGEWLPLTNSRNQYRGSGWRRRHETLVNDGNYRPEERSYCYRRATIDGPWVNNVSENDTTNEANQQSTKYGRGIWQGNERGEYCYAPSGRPAPDGSTARLMVLTDRLVAAYVWMSVKEQKDYSTSPNGTDDHGDIHTAAMAAYYAHWTQGTDWTFTLNGSINPAGSGVGVSPSPYKVKSFGMPTKPKQFFL